MADYFISKLPSGHAIKDLTKPIAINTVRSEPMIIAPPETTVFLLRRQCAAVVWVWSDAYSRENVEKLPPVERAYLLQLFSLPGGGTAKAQCLLTHSPLVLRLQRREVPAEEPAEEEPADHLHLPQDRVVSF
jgi:hypothetical protein